MKLIVGTDSTWSLRAWICLRLANINTTELVIDLNAADYKSRILAYSPNGLVPALIDDTIALHDSLAITEYANELSQGKLYPNDVKDRALARSLCAEMHAGFVHLRTHLPFTLQTIPPVELYKNSDNKRLNKGIKQELIRVEEIFNLATVPYMFEQAGAVDAFYAILAFRLNHYGIHFEGKGGQYQQSLLNWHPLKAAIQQAEKW